MNIFDVQILCDFFIWQDDQQDGFDCWNLDAGWIVESNSLFNAEVLSPVCDLVVLSCQMHSKFKQYYYAVSKSHILFRNLFTRNFDIRIE